MKRLVSTSQYHNYEPEKWSQKEDAPVTINKIIIQMTGKRIKANMHKSPDMTPNATHNNYK